LTFVNNLIPTLSWTTLKEAATSSSETPEINYQSALRHIPEDLKFKTCIQWWILDGPNMEAIKNYLWHSEDLHR